MINLQSGDVNKLRQMLASGQITEDQLLAMSFHGGDSAPQQAPQNALAQALSPQQAFAQGDTSGDLPMGSMRNEVTGKITYFQPDPQAPRTNADPGFSDTPYPLPSARPQSPRARLYGYGDGGLTDLGEDTSGAIPLDYSRGQIEVPGVGKAHYSRDGRFAVARGPNGEAVKVMLGYDAAASDRRNAMALKQEGERADIAQTQERTGMLRDQRAALANPPPPERDKAPPGYRWAGDGLEPVPGGPADAKVGKEAEAKKKRLDAAVSRTKFVLGKVNDAINMIGPLSTGAIGQATRGLGNSPAFNLEKAIDPIKANIGFSELQAMREASPTGGALGQVAVQELNMLQSVLGSLDTAQGETELLKSLNAIHKHFTNWQRAVKQANDGAPVDGGGNDAAVGSPRVRKFNPATGRIE